CGQRQRRRRSSGIRRRAPSHHRLDPGGSGHYRCATVLERVLHRRRTIHPVCERWTMSKQPGQQHEPADNDKPTTPLSAGAAKPDGSEAPEPESPEATESNAQPPAEPAATPRRRRRRVDPDGETLHTGSPAAGQTTPMPTSDAVPGPTKPPMDEIMHPTTPPPAGVKQPFATTPAQQAPAAHLPTEPLEDSFEDAAAARARARDRAVVGSPVAAMILQVVRSEERRVGKEWRGGRSQQDGRERWR